MHKHLKLLFVILAISGVLHAQTKRTQSTPADGQVIQTLPEQLTLRFKSDVSLTAARMTLPSGQTHPASLGAKRDAQQQFSLALPNGGPGTYLIDYTTRSHNGDTEQHRISFLLAH